VNENLNKNDLKLQFNKTYFFSFIVLLLIETTIALFITNGFIRSTFGDVLVVMLMYCFFKSFINIKPFPIAVSVLMFAFTLEFLQLFKLTEILNPDNNPIIKVILGSTFQISDLLAYSFGILIILMIEYKIQK